MVGTARVLRNAVAAYGEGVNFTHPDEPPGEGRDAGGKDISVIASKEKDTSSRRKTGHTIISYVR